LDFELRALLDSGDADSFKKPFAGRDHPFVDAISVARHRSLVASEAWEDLAAFAALEEQNRHKDRRVVLQECHRMLTFRPTCSIKSGASVSGLMNFDDPSVSFLGELHRTTLRAPVHIASVTEPPFVEVRDSAGLLVQCILLCVIPEELVDQACPAAPLPWLLPTARSPLAWVSASDPQRLATLLCDDGKDGFVGLSPFASWHSGQTPFAHCACAGCELRQVICAHMPNCLIVLIGLAATARPVVWFA